jgi:hypothetical protein
MPAMKTFLKSSDHSRPFFLLLLPFYFLATPYKPQGYLRII